MAGTRLLGSQDSNSIRRKASRARGARVLNRRGCVRALARRGTATWPDERRARVSRSRERGDPARRTGVRRGTSEVVTGWSGSLSRRAQGVCGLRRRTTEFSDEPRRPTGPKLPRSKAVAPSDGSAARTARPATLELLAHDDAAQRRKRSAGKARIDRKVEAGANAGCPPRASRTLSHLIAALSNLVYVDGTR